MAKHRQIDRDLLRLRDLATENPEAREVLVAVDAAMSRGATDKEVKRVYRETLEDLSIDENAATELDLYAESTREFYGQFTSIIANLKNKIEKGRYDPKLAPKLWRYWYHRVAAAYAREFGGWTGGRGGASSSVMFPTPLLRVLSKRRATEEHAMILAGEYGPLKVRSAVAKRKHR